MNQNKMYVNGKAMAKFEIRYAIFSSRSTGRRHWDIFGNKQISINIMCESITIV